MEDLVVQEVKLTYCFYENPAAKQEIKFWESLVEDRIKTKSFIGDNWGYSLEKDDEREFLCCIPLQDLNRDFEPTKVADDVFGLHRENEFDILVYNKVLIFGKVETEQLTYISTKMKIWQK
jgi:hypothetical protein